MQYTAYRLATDPKQVVDVPDGVAVRVNDVLNAAQGVTSIIEIPNDLLRELSEPSTIILQSYADGGIERDAAQDMLTLGIAASEISGSDAAQLEEITRAAESVMANL